MKKYQGLIPFTLALILAAIVVIWSFKEQNDPQPAPPKPTNEFEQRIDVLESEKEQLKQQRDSALVFADSVALSRKSDSILIKKLEKEILEIPGRYRNVSQDSLGKLMDERANGRQNH